MDEVSRIVYTGVVRYGIGPLYRGAAAATADYTAAFARTAEDAGCDSIWAAEHVVVPDKYASRYPYSPEGRMGLTADDAIPDPIEWLAFAAAVTTTVKLGTAILILPEHNPVMLAKRLATLDALSGGRVLAGVGVGWLREEADAVGVPFEERGRRADEYVAALRALWRDRPARFEGRFVHFDGVSSTPAPAQPGGIPIHVGGGTPAAARRAGRLGDGYYPLGVGPDELAPLLEVMRGAAEEAGRDPSAIDVTVAATFTLDKARRYRDLGVSRMMLRAGDHRADSVRTTVERFHDAVMSRL